MTFLKNNWLTIVVLMLVVVAGIYIYKEMKEAKTAKSVSDAMSAQGIPVSTDVAEEILNGAMYGTGVTEM